MSRTAKELEFLVSQNLNNLADVPDDEELVIKYLMRRYAAGKYYTWVGPVLLAINPRQSDSDAGQVFFAPLTSDSLEPHVFAVAAKARRRLVQGVGKSDQMIVISGDSGSGKTFSASQILRFLAATDQSVSSSPSTTVSNIEKACLVLSPFCTASTERNRCSSRHGQLVKLQYVNGEISGAVVESFLLEQSRVTSGADNFHIFGQVLSGLNEPGLETLRLSKESVEGKKVDGFHDTVAAMDYLGIESKQREDIFRIIAIIVHLGNIRFKQAFGNGCDVDVDRKDSANALEAACGLMALPEEDLVRLLTTSLIRPQSLRHSMYHSAMANAESCVARLHSIVRYLYRRLVYWLLDRLNKTLCCGGKNARFLGILDIFGFEYFSENSIEQLSINYANERMQLHFMQKYLEAGRAELESEGLATLPPPTTSAVYDQRLASLECGLFPALNDACLVARIDKHARVDDIILSARDEDQRFIRKRGERFAIRHYSCIVEYKTADILRKNIDKVPGELLSTFSLCRNKFLRSLFDGDDEMITQQRNGRKNTALAKLKQSIDQLVKELERYDLHYVRCLKPIQRLDDPETRTELRQQLACSGILDALPMARCALPIRMRYDEFRKRFSPTSSEIEDPIHMCEATLLRVLNEEEFQSLVHFGSGLIFLAESVLSELEIMRDEYRSRCATRIQRSWRDYNTEKKRIEINKLLCDRNIDSGEIKIHKAPSMNLFKNGFKADGKVPESEGFFRRDGILSRRRLAEVPVRFHMKLTCLMDSHRLPRSELPQGLRDCLP